MTNPQYNIVLIYCKINLYLKFSVTNYDVPDSDSGTCTLYTKLCVLVQSHDMIFLYAVSIGNEIAINGRKLQLNKSNKSG
jgi:hypothetical protein